MVKGIKEPGKDSIISVAWDENKIRTFLRNLSKGSIFGYSNAFTFEQIEDYVIGEGMIAVPFSIKDPLREKYGLYILKVIKPYSPKNKIIRAWFDDLIFYEHTTAKGNRKCKGKNCSTTIKKGNPVVESVDLVIIPGTMNRAYKKCSYCSKCSERIIARKISSLLNVLSGKISSVSNSEISSLIMKAKRA